MVHFSTGRRWAPLAFIALLCGAIALLAPSTVGAQEAPRYEVGVTGECPTTIDGTVTYIVSVTNNGADPIDVVALDQSFTVAAGATGTAEFSENDVSSGLVNSITVEGEPAEGVVVATPGCAAPEPPSSSDEPASSSDEPPSSSDEPPSSDIDAIPIAAPLNPKFTG